MGVTKAKSLSQRFLAESFANISSSARLRDAERTFCTDKAAGGELRLPPDEVFASHVLGVARAPDQRGPRGLERGEQWHPFTEMWFLPRFAGKLAQRGFSTG